MIDKLPFVTIAIPFYNSERFLHYAIQSVINQTYTNWELFLIDDGSNDNSLAVAKDFAERDGRIIIVSDGLNKGLPARLNDSVKIAKGDYYARMDADDIMTVDRIALQICYMEEHPNVDVIGSSAMVIDNDNNIIKSYDQHGVINGFIHPTVMAKTKWFKENPYDEKLKRSQDTELWMRTAKRCHFYNIQKPLLFYREIGNISLSKKLKSNKTLRSICKNYKKYDKNIWWCIKWTIIYYVEDVVYVISSFFGLNDMTNTFRKINELPKEMKLTASDLRKSVMKL